MIKQNFFKLGLLHLHDVDAGVQEQRRSGGAKRVRGIDALLLLGRQKNSTSHPAR